MAFKVFIDTDVIIDLLIDRRPHAVHATKIFDLSDRNLIIICTSALCINNVHYIVKKVLGDKKARSVINDLLNLMKVLDVTEADLRNAVTSNFKDFEDAIQHFVALNETGVKSIVTRNTKDFKKSQLAVFLPETFVDMIESKP